MLSTTRKVLDRTFSGLGFFAIGLMTFAILIILLPIFVKGIGAFVFRGTIEHRELMLEVFERGNHQRINQQLAAANEARQPIYEMLETFRKEDLQAMSGAERREARMAIQDLEERLYKLLGPKPGETVPVLLRKRYGETRWHRTLIALEEVLYVEEWDYSDPTKMGEKRLVPREQSFAGTSLEKLFPYLQSNIDEIMAPRWTFYWRFLFDKSYDAHFFGGIGPELLGTIYLTIGAMIFALPMGIIAAIYLVEYAGQNLIVRFIRVCISTLAGVPSIVFGLFGLAFFINTIHVSESKSVLAGALTLALLVLPTVIRASEEAILAVPHTFKEAALSLGAGKWRTIVTVMLPAALPGILTGVVISMGRAAGETAPIIFTAAVSVGPALGILETLNEPTPALPWNIYNLATEHEAVNEIRHVQYGMVFTLISLVLLLNASAIFMRARITRKLRG